MAVTLQTKDVLPLLAERGIATSREGLAAMSDLLALRTRAREATSSPRRWGPTEVEFLTVAFLLKREWGLDRDTIHGLATGREQFAEALVDQFRAALGLFLDHAQRADVASRSWESESVATPASGPGSQAESDAA